jgi:hypothetical protein
VGRLYRVVDCVEQVGADGVDLDRLAQPSLNAATIASAS